MIVKIGLSVIIIVWLYLFPPAPMLVNWLDRRRRKDKPMSSASPLLDIIMLVHDQAAWADLAIRAVEHQTRHPYRLIIVDSASVEPKTRELLKEAERRGHTVIRLAENRSFSHGVNAGVRVGNAPYISILNDDAIVTEDWDSALLQDAAPERIGLVGARSNFASGAQMDPSFVGEPPYLVFVCVALRREVWNKVGPMDEETFDSFSSEDIDYAWRVKKAGYKLAVSNAFVLHAGSRTLAATTGAMTGPGQMPEARARNEQKYNARLIDKHGKDWVARHTQLRKKCLVVSYHSEEYTRVAFMDAFHKLRHHGDYVFDFMRVTRMSIALARNATADYALDNGFDVLFQLDDDATFPPDVMRRLLAHDKQIVCALAYQRKPPHFTCAFELGPDGMMGSPLENIERTGLRRVDVSGFHCSAIHTSVFKQMRDGKTDKDGKVIVPGTRVYYGGFDNKVGEDFAFCLNARKLGINVYVDTDLISGHIGSSIVVDEEYKKRYAANLLPASLGGR